MGVVLMCVGVVGKCFVFKYFCVMIYQLLGGVQGQVFDIEIIVCEIQKLKKEFYDIIVMYFGQMIEKVWEDFDCDYWMILEEVKVYGMIDEVLFCNLK